ncbi:protein O-mannosyl-transferase TMTC2 [Bactrocera dorsalis]|uniref:dolichyl-phosphate-mannose--protein mannosyltransferase n=1 Tax=Bactrocera dorsalis TaxID=27457 RepID=A0ABM3K966_BACDO|nr:protein O-mannosyl-transferase TMTC2 [Bactrocera dorsalis]
MSAKPTLWERWLYKSSMDYTSLGCCTLAFVLYLNTLNAGFVYDDRRAILANTDVSGHTPWQSIFQHDYWGTPLTDAGSHGSYRPLCVLSFRFNFLLGGYTPWGFHLINNLMHCLATGLVVKLARYFLNSVWGVLATGAIFAAHPIHTEAVAGIVGRADLAACIFYLLTYLMYMRHIVWRERGEVRQWWALILTLILSLVALLFKETAITALLVCAIFDGLRGLCGFRDKHRMRTLCILAVSLMCIVYWRLLVLPRPQTAFSTADNPIAKMPSMWTRFLTFLYLPVFNFSLLLSPRVLSFDWGMDAIPRITSIRDERNLLSFAFYSTLAALAFKCFKYLWRRRAERIAKEQRHAQQQQQQLRKSRSKKKYRIPDITAAALESNSTYSLLDATTLSRAPYSAAASTTTTTMQSLLQPEALPNSAHLSCHCHDCKQELSSAHHTATCRALNNNNNNNVHWLNANAFSDCCCHQLFQSSSGAPHLLAVALRKALMAVVPRSSRSSSRCSSSTTASNNSSGSNSSSSSNCSSASATQAADEQRARLTASPTALTPRAAQHTNNACILLMALSFLTLPFIPATNLFFYVGFVVAERLLYLPSVGYCLLAGYGVGKLMERVRSPAARKRKVALILGLSLLLSVLGARTVQRNYDWYDEESLFRSAVQVNPPKALGNLGSVLSSQGRYEEAQEALIEAIKHRPNMADVHFNLGILYQNQQNHKAAVECFRKAIQFRPNLAVAFLNLGASLIALGRCREAAQILKDGTQLHGTGVRDRAAHDNARISSYLQLGALYAEQGKLQRALAVYREALHALPSTYYQRDVLYNRIGDVFGRLQQWNEAERYHYAALQLQPNQVAAHLSYGITLARNSSRAAEAEVWFKRALRLAPQQSSAHHYYAEFLTSQSRSEEAIFYRIRAAELAPDDYALVVAAATALRLSERKAEAESWYRKAVAMRPNDAHAHTNLGAILHLLGRTKHAAHSYQEALRLQPGDPTTLGNLAKLGVIEPK